MHETAEETVVYPTLMWTGTDAVEAVRLRAAEEDQAKRDLADLEAMNPASDEFDELFTAFRSDIEVHADAEEREILPRLEEVRHRAELVLMDKGFVFIETIAPTHAHRLAPESALGNLLVGPVIGVIDRARDLLADSRR